MSAMVEFMDEDELLGEFHHAGIWLPDEPKPLPGTSWTERAHVQTSFDPLRNEILFFVGEVCTPRHERSTVRVYEMRDGVEFEMYRADWMPGHGDDWKALARSVHAGHPGSQIEWDINPEEEP